MRLLEGFLLAQQFYGWVAGSHKTLARFSGLTPHGWLSTLRELSDVYLGESPAVKRLV
jgi:hypothetical protein